MTKHLSRFLLVVGFITAIASTQAASAKDFLCAAQTAAAIPGQRIHIGCSPADGAIGFFAFSVKQSEDANPILSLVTSALIANRRIKIRYDPNDLSGAAIGCATQDCRMIQLVELF